MELAILGKQKSAGIVALLEEMRRDSPTLRNRVDEEAAAMSVAADPEAVPDAIKETGDAPLAADLMTAPDAETDLPSADKVRPDRA